MFSLVTLTRNRPWFIERLLRYYAVKELKAPLLIADGSDAEPCSELAGHVARYSDRLDVRHFPYGPLVPAYQRLKNVVDQVRTTYVVWIGDDDFFIPARIDDAIGILERDPGVASVVGSAVLFVLSPGKFNGHRVRIGPYAQAARPEPNAVSRLLTHLLDQHSTAYSVRRTWQTAGNLGVVAGCGWGDDHFHFAELLESALTVIEGRIALMKRLTMVRQTHQGQSSVANVTGRTLFDLLVDGSWERYHGPFTRAIANALRDKAGLDSAAAQQAAALALRSSVSATLARKIGGEYQRKGLVSGLGESAQRLIERYAPSTNRRLLNRIVARIGLLRLTRGADAAEFATILRMLEQD